MTVFACDGFESYGNKSSAGSDVQDRINNTESNGDGSTAFVSQSGGHGGDVSIIDDFETVGFALEFPDLDAARAEFVRYEYPDGSGRYPDYKLSTNSSVPVFVTGWRFFNADTTPALTKTIWNNLQGSGSSLSSLAIASNATDLTFTPASGSATTIVGALTPDEWHYIEVEYKPTTSANGGYIKVYVDDVEVANISASLASFTFFTTFGVEIGFGASGGNQTAGNRCAIDDVYHMAIDGVKHTARLGPCRVLVLSPASDDTPNDWSPSTGSDNHNMVDNDDWATTDYVEAATTGDDDHYGLDTLAAVDTVHGMSISVVCEATDGTPNLHIGFDNGTADEEDMGTVATGGEQQLRMFFDDDPSGVVWNTTSVNSAEATQRMTE